VRRARRSPVLWWSAAAAVAALAAARVAALDDEAAARREAWGEGVEVLVAVRPLAVGDVLGAGDVAVEAWPRAVVPDGALDASAPVAGRTAVSPIVEGEALVDARLAPAGLSPVAARIPPGHRAVAVPITAGGFATEAPPVEVGDRVDVLATFDVLESDAPPTAPVARGALVVEVADTRVTIAVEADDAAPVAFALARGTVTLALVGAPGP
jgi:Flp pilus assembly protein CpaB